MAAPSATLGTATAQQSEVPESQAPQAPRLPLTWPENSSLLSCVEADGVLKASGRRLWRSRGGRTTLVSSPREGGLGTVLDLAPAPDGATFMVTDRGLFFTRPESITVGAVDIRDGAPRGRPVGVHADGRVVWLATDEEFGCVDPHQFYGRTFTLNDGLDALIPIESDTPLPIGPFVGFGVAADGGFLLHTASQVFAYLPGRLPTPKLIVREVAGKPFQPGKVTAASGGSVILKLDAECAGTPSFRYRSLWNHQWTPMVGDPLRVMYMLPGRNTIEVIALDRELNRSAPVRVELDVPYPLHQRTFTVCLVTACAELVAVALLLRHWRRKRPAGWAKGLLGVFLVTVIGGQTLVGVLHYRRAEPFRGFWMLLDRTKKRGVVYKLQLIGIERDGREREIDALWGGGPELRPQRQMISLIHGGQDDMRAFLGRCNRRHPEDPLRGVAVRAKRWRLTEKGPVLVAAVEYVRYELKP